ncbi:CHASE2 domain-containing protein [Hwanghaeella grinnelliae]|uniref:CHASE2 domain-containing protein n=1 Tax=Hwanghaeella grinnelliae TaxID=2500179 RepID=A0A3S2VPL3_9PROT|nr:CHASE2 domain-containing protein [Hwanghaeella grinnelliae]RVU35977.1 CHASE2 domain-containing protein [Hwanghaeella grinnelliae]
MTNDDKSGSGGASGKNRGEDLVGDGDETVGWSNAGPIRTIITGKGRPLSVFLLLVALVVLLGTGDLLTPWRNMGFDIQQRLHPRQAENLPVMIVEIDEKALQAYGQWPWPRTMVANLIQAITFRGALVVGLDLLFPEPDRLSLNQIAEDRDDLSDEVRNILRTVRSNDEILAGVVGRVPVVLGRAALTGDEAEVWKKASKPMPPTDLQDPSLLNVLPKADAVVTNLPVLEGNAIGLGVLNGEPDSDGIVRRVPLAMNIDGEPHAGMILEVLRVGLGSPDLMFLGQEGRVSGVRIGPTDFPTDPDARVTPYFTESLDARFVSAADVLSGRVDSILFKNRLVLVGVTGIGVVDKRATPVSPLVHGVEIQAQVLENLLYGTRLIRPAWAIWAEAALMLVLGGLVIWLMPIVKPWIPVALFVVVGGAAAVASHLAFRFGQLQLDPILPSVLSTVILLSMLGVMIAEIDRRRRTLRATLQTERIGAARIAGELQAARDIQMGILPDVSALPGVPAGIDIAAFLESAKEVGGDLYDAFMVDEKRLFFLVGDVTGKGVPASLFMALSKAMSKSAALRGPGVAMNAIIEMANDEISRENPADLFVTMFAGVIDGETGHVEFCNAGHEDPHIVSADGTVRVLECDGGPPLCVFEGFPYPKETLTLAPGETLVITTDGVTEARNTTGGFYGHDRLEVGLGRMVGEADLNAGLGTLVRDVRTFEDGADPTDDLTLMAIRFKGA